MKLYVGVDLFFVSKPFPSFVKAFLKFDKGIYYIYVNSNLSTEGQEKAVKHEYTHLINDDCNSEDERAEIERRNK